MLPPGFEEWEKLPGQIPSRRECDLCERKRFCMEYAGVKTLGRRLWMCLKCARSQ